MSRISSGVRPNQLLHDGVIENVAQVQQQLRQLGTASARRYVFVQKLLQVDLGRD